MKSPAPSRAVYGVSAALTLFVACLLPTGCAGYRVGSMLPKDIETVFVAPLQNESSEPLIEQDIMQALIREIQNDGSLEVVRDQALADASLEVRLTRFSLNSISFSSRNSTLTEEYRMTLTAAVRLERPDGEVIVARNGVQGEADFPFTSDLTTTKRQFLPRAAEDLANDIIQVLVETW